MQLQQIRNATLRLTYGEKTFLLDPWLASDEVRFRFIDIPGMPFHTPDPVKERLPMPLYPLPEPTEKILTGVDAYVVTHIHPDHVDMSPFGKVGSPLNKKTPVWAQNDVDAEVFRQSGFGEVLLLSENGAKFGGVTLYKTPAKHGTVVPCGDACGVIFAAEGEKTLYVAGDTVWYDGVAQTLAKYQPDIVVLNACAAETVENGRLIMNDEDVACVAKTLPQAQIVLSHFDNVAHATITRHTMRGLMAGRGIDNYLLPADGEILTL